MFDLIDIIRVFVNYVNGLIASISLIQFEVGSVTVNFFDLILGFFAMVMIISVFWKGARAR